MNFSKPASGRSGERRTIRQPREMAPRPVAMNSEVTVTPSARRCHAITRGPPTASSAPSEMSRVVSPEPAAPMTSNTTKVSPDSTPEASSVNPAAGTVAPHLRRRR